GEKAGEQAGAPSRLDELRKWLEFGFETIDGALLAIIKIGPAAEQVRYAERLDALRDLIWTTLEEMGPKAAELPPGTTIINAVSEKEAEVVRLLFPQTSRFIAMARMLLGRKFTKDDALTRARIRSNLLIYWDHASVMV